MLKSLFKILKENKLFTVLVLLSIISSMRSFVVPLGGDETTYLKIAKNILEGKYYMNEYPSTVTPIVPFILAFFYTSFAPMLGFALMKLFNIILTIIGFRYVYQFLLKLEFSTPIVLSILLLAIINTNSIAWFSSLYPEALLFVSFWGFIYYYSLEKSFANFKKMLLFFLLLTMTRYLYGILGLIVLIYYYECIPHRSSGINFVKVIGYSILCSIPVLLWFKYVYGIEQNELSEISYFARFQNNNTFLSNVKYGLGIGIHPEVSRVNGIPAFISLFVPITGIRNYLISVVFILMFILGYIRIKKSFSIKLIFISTLLVLLGFMISGTGFSRYWLLLLPSFHLGFYFLFSSFKFNDKWFVLMAKILAIVYVINELRLDYIVLNRYL